MDQEKAKALFFEGIALFDAADFAGAEAKLRAALAIAPDRPSALTNLAAALFEQEKLVEAEDVAHHSTEVDPTSAEAWITLSATLTKLRRADKALSAAERAVAAAPGSPSALMARASAFSEIKRHDLAVADYEAAARINPHQKNLRGLLVSAKMYACDWRGLAAETERLLADVRAGGTPVKPFTLLAIPGATAADQLRCATATVAIECPPRAPLYRGVPYDRDRIRVAYVSGDFRRHPLAYLMAGVFEHHDRGRFETFGISCGIDDDSDIRRRVLAAFEHVFDVAGQSDRDVAALLEEQEIDVAVDLGGLTSGGRPRVFASRPAPTQVSFLGFPGTSGMPYIDYILADSVVVPDADRRHYSEKVVWLPDSYYPHDDRQPIALSTPSRADCGLPETGFVFCSFNNAYKIAPAIFATWMQLLAGVPGSVLWLLDSTAGVAANLRREAAARGVAPERLIFAETLPTERHLARQRLADLFLDTLPYNAHTTAIDALWAGLPVVTCPGGTFPGRVAASLLGAIGLSELVADSLDDYAALAVGLARDPTALAALKAKLAANQATTPLFDTARFTRHLEQAYATMVERHRRGEPPVAFTAERDGLS